MILICLSLSVGFGDRLLAEIKKLTPKDVKIRVCVSIFVNLKSLIGDNLSLSLSLDISSPGPTLFNMDGVSSRHNVDPCRLST